MSERAIYLTALTIHLVAVASWFGGNIFFIGFVALSRREPFLKNIRARLIYIYAISYRKMTYYLFFFALSSGLMLVHANGLLNPGLFTLPAGKMALAKMALFFIMLVLQLLHDFFVGPRSYIIEGDTVKVRDEFRLVNRIVGWTVFLLTCSLFFLGILLSRKVVF